MHWLFSVLSMRLLLLQSVPLAALISLQTLQNALNTFGYLAVTVCIMIESSGIPFPGETMLLLASFSAATITPQLQIPLVIACAALGAILGDNLGYLAGRTGGRALALRFGRYVFLKPQHLDRAERFFAKHGDKTVFFGRFFSVLRAWSAFLAGINHMPWRNFLFYNAAGGIVWAIVYGTFGYVAGRVFKNNFPLVESIASTTGWIGAGFIVVVVVTIYIFYRVRHRQNVVETSIEKVQDTEQADATDDELLFPSPISPDSNR
ncbi:MAG: DedA family protein [Ktedonobacteraceae bacterium]